jgi:hypothetical protein
LYSVNAGEKFPRLMARSRETAALIIVFLIIGSIFLRSAIIHSFYSDLYAYLRYFLIVITFMFGINGHVIIKQNRSNLTHQL